MFDSKCNLHQTGLIASSKITFQIFGCSLIDYEAPSFGETCPSARSVFADEGKTSATISWEPVIATDNDQAIVSMSPQVTSPHIFSEGNHSITFTAKDLSGNAKFCHFQVNVQGICGLHAKIRI